ncbi:MAG: hypothetical protein K8S98_17515 [Planctomycetes bacterium]|nr:hypothetical protein [Planctomycetota bacterium]
MLSRVLALWLWVSFALAAFAPVARAAPQNVCKTCAGTGLAPCRPCAKSHCTAKHEVLFCSIASRCKACGGTQLAPCKCAASPKVSLDAKRAALAAWVTKRPAEIAEFMGREVAVAESAHFVLVWDVPKVDVKGVTDLHGALHLYLDRLEDFYARFCDDVGAVEKDFISKTIGLVWSREADQEKASPKYTLQPSNTESKLMGRAPVFSLFYDKGHMHEEYELHQAIVHHASHCLLSNVFNGIWSGNIKGGWADEGLAHWYENSLFDGVRHYCYVEQDTQVDFKFGKWEAGVRQALDDGKLPSVFAFTALNTTEMTPPQKMYAWALVDYLLRGPKKSFGAFARAAKEKRSFADACQAILGRSALDVDRDWRAWIAATYSATPKAR